MSEGLLGELLGGEGEEPKSGGASEAAIGAEARSVRPTGIRPFPAISPASTAGSRPPKKRRGIPIGPTPC
jgi:hypothetical protein